MIGEKAGYLGEGKDEDQVEEQFQRSYALLGEIPALSAIPAEPSVPIRCPPIFFLQTYADERILASAARLLSPGRAGYAKVFKCSGELQAANFGENPLGEVLMILSCGTFREG